MQKVSKTFKILMSAQGVLWFGFVIYGIVKQMQSDASMNGVVMLLMALNGMLFILLPLFFDKAFWIKLLTLVFLAVNLLLTFTDQTGFFDYVVLVLNSASIICAVYILWKRRAGEQ